MLLSLINLCCCSCEPSCLSKAACLPVRPACATCPSCQAVLPACQFFHISLSLSHFGHSLASESRSMPPVSALRHPASHFRYRNGISFFRHRTCSGIGISFHPGNGLDNGQCTTVWHSSYLRNRLRDMASQEQRMAGWESYGAQRKLAGLDVLGAGWLSAKDSLQNGGWSLAIG